ATRGPRHWGLNPKTDTPLLSAMPFLRKPSQSSNIPQTDRPDSSCTYVCIECTYPVKTLYTRFASADDRKLGRGFQLTQCPRCKRFADKYVEHDFVVLFIDLVLIKPQVYRHLLFNRLGSKDDKLDVCFHHSCPH